MERQTAEDRRTFGLEGTCLLTSRSIPQALVDGPSADSALAVTRQAVSFSNVVLTDLVLAGLPRATRTATVKKFWEKAGIDSKFKSSNWAKKKDVQSKRAGLTDFERFSVLRLKKQRRFEERKELAKIVKA